MNSKQFLFAIGALLIIGTGAGTLVHLKTHQRLGKPGVVTRAVPGAQNEEVVLPEQVLNYSSKHLPTDQLAIDVLPADTCFGARHYKAADDFEVVGNIVLMGTDRTSLHKPQYCLRGQGWQILTTERVDIPISKPFNYSLPATKIIVTREIPSPQGPPTTLNGVYVYWYVADQAFSGDPTGAERMWSSARKLFTTGELQRWAYVTFLAACPPGQEAATFKRLQEFIAAAVPEFQTTQPQKEIANGAKY